MTTPTKPDTPSDLPRHVTIFGDGLPRLTMARDDFDLMCRAALDGLEAFAADYGDEAALSRLERMLTHARNPLEADA